MVIFCITKSFCCLPSVVKEESDHVDEQNAYSFSRNLENFSSWLQQITMTGNLEVIFPAATREYSPLVEELWKDKAFQAIYKRRNELPMLPRVANYFLDRVSRDICSFLFKMLHPSFNLNFIHTYL